MSNADDLVLVDRPAPGLATVTIHRPQRRNACNAAAWAALRDAFAKLAQEPKGLRGVVLTGAGSHFCAGDDVVEYAQVRGDANAERRYLETIVAVYEAIRSAPFPVVAAIEGACVGGGCSLAMACDFRIGRVDARIGISAARLGLLYPALQTRRLVSMVGLSHARRWLYEGALFSGEEAAAMGFLDETAGSPIEAARAWLQRSALSAPLSVAGFKQQLNALQDDALEERASALQDMEARVSRSMDVREAALAFREKRPPLFTGT